MPTLASTCCVRESTTGRAPAITVRTALPEAAILSADSHRSFERVFRLRDAYRGVLSRCMVSPRMFIVLFWRVRSSAALLPWVGCDFPVRSTPVRSNCTCGQDWHTHRRNRTIVRSWKRLFAASSPPTNCGNDSGQYRPARQRHESPVQQLRYCRDRRRGHHDFARAAQTNRSTTSACCARLATDSSASRSTSCPRTSSVRSSTSACQRLIDIQVAGRNIEGNRKLP